MEHVIIYTLVPEGLIALSFVKRITRSAIVSASLFSILCAGNASAVDNNLFKYEHSCRAALSEYRLHPKLKHWAKNADCHWHPELDDGKGMWYLY